MLGLGFLAFSFEGLICIVMASPLLGGIALIGGLVGYAIQYRGAGDKEIAKTTFLLFLLLPLSGALERDQVLPASKVVTRVAIAAPVQVVWDQLVAFSPIPEKRAWLFHTGVAYPTHAEIRGTGPGAIRYCYFSTGRFVEPIDVWDEPFRLAFRVSERPDPMKELSPFGEIHPPHLQGTLLTERGEFLLEPQADGGVLLTGTTWYRQNLWPNLYWRLWTNWIIHQVHERVLGHIRLQAEGAAPVDDP